ncbi:choice-of-anchor tandem repeat GloVer-containing protein [Luteolibacter sp. LG18]|uniref:choice-of-anchor tandem repeat GloVer-containing protein n=1 Tax=Luteolibacter sp. LG18 TaxID=2819286 RepID=UPI0030C67CB8
MSSKPVFPRGVQGVAAACAVFAAGALPVSAAGPILKTLHAFDSEPAGPAGGLIPAGDGSYFGTTVSGGLYARGTVFRMAADNTVTVLASFNGTNGSNPLGRLLLTPDGNLWGTTRTGGSANLGTVFRLSPSGELTSISITEAVGANPQGRLARDAAGNLYGTTAQGMGTIFKVSPDLVLTKHATLGNPRFPADDLMTAADGNVYGVASTGNDAQGGFGAIFRVETAGGISVFARIPIEQYGYAQYGLVQDGAGNFYGTTNGGGLAPGVVYQCSPAGTLSVIAPFALSTIPGSVLAIGANGSLYGVTSYVGTTPNTLFRASVAGGMENLYTFDGSAGSRPSGMILSPSGTLLGTAAGGTTSTSVSWFGGGVFEFNPTGAQTSLKVKFLHAAQNPAGSLATGPDGNLYGVTTGLGAEAGGLAFRVTPQGGYTALSGLSTNPSHGLTTGADGKVYGIVSNDHTGGVFCRVDTNGSISNLAFLDSVSGYKPPGELVVGADGGFYGVSTGLTGTLFRVTTAGQLSKVAGPLVGSSVGRVCFGADGSTYLAYPGWYPSYRGSICRVLANGTQETVVTFDGSNGANPAAGLILASDGNFYGTTSGELYTGPGQYGTIFRLTPEGVLSTIFTFDGTNGSTPKTELIQGADGRLYGTTSAGGDGGNGTVFRCGLDGTLTTLVDFDFYNGSDPAGALTIGPDGQFYGSTRLGGVDEGESTGGGGTVYKLDFAPEATTGNAEVLSATATVLHGSVAVHGMTTTVSFEYGTDAGLAGAAEAAVTTIPDTQDGGAVNVRLDGLTLGTTYYFRVKAACPGMAAQYGQIGSFVASGVDASAGPEEFLFCALDGNRDDKLTAAEWKPIYVKAPAKETAFALLDVNVDGFLDFSEFSAAASNRTTARTFSTAVDRTALFLSVDASEDNEITKAELAKMWKPGTPSLTVDTWMARAGVGATIDFWEWLHAATLPNERTYSQAAELRETRLAFAAQLDTDHDEVITFAEFSRMFKAGTKVKTIDTAWRTANQTPRDASSPASMTIEAFVEAPRLPKLVIYSTAG